MRLNTVNKIIIEWEYYKDLIMDLSMVISTEDYKKILSRDGECGGSVELPCISRFISNFLSQSVL